MGSLYAHDYALALAARREAADRRPTGCSVCSRVVREAPSPVRAFAWLVVTNAHREHWSPYRGDLPF